MKYERIIELFIELIKEYSNIDKDGVSDKWEEVNSFSDEEIKEQVKESLKFTIDQFNKLGLKMSKIDIDGDIVVEEWSNENQAYSRKYNARELYNMLPEMVERQVMVSLMDNAVEEERYEDAAFWRDAANNI